jgi:ergothioneine biosynthesis protein EgtB
VATSAVRTEAAVAQKNIDLAAEFSRIRDSSLALCSSLEIEDCVVQSMPDASPLKWHLAHTTWFFEQFVLAPMHEGYQVFDERYAFLFNSYYQSAGPMHDRPARGLLSRPTVADVIRYRRVIDDAIHNLLLLKPSDPRLKEVIALGLQHEQQHQELMLADIKHAFSLNPLAPVYRPRPVQFEHFNVADAEPLRFIAFDGGIRAIGAIEGEFCYDNEQPRHRVFLEPFALASRLITNDEFLEFIREGGYNRSEFWLSDGWDVVVRERWSRPLYWQPSLDSEFTLHGMAELQWNAPVAHLSYYEAEAFARWAGARLPSEAEWEVVAANSPLLGNLFQTDALHPLPASSAVDGNPVKQLFGDVWEWTGSSYAPYPGYRELEGALGEYNGKFMSNRMVLRGGSCVTPDDHIRATYRNYFAPQARWQFSGVRLAQ